jgi:hypothetical protein
MYLMDAIAATAQLAIDTGQTDSLALSMYPDLAGRLTGAPRFLLDRATIEAATELTLGRPKIMLEALTHLAAPYPAMWVEWEEAGRHRLREKWPTLSDGAPAFTDDRPLPSRLGFLLEADPSGRKGMLTWLWLSPASETVPNVAPFSPYFDLDAPPLEPPAGHTLGLLKGNLAKMWADNPVQNDALLGLWRLVRHSPSEWGEKYLRWMGATPERLANALADVYGEWIHAVSVLLLLTASRQAVNYREIDRSRLNKTRLKRREVPLLDHTEVVMHLRGRQAGEQPRAPLGYARKSPRIHMVSRYLARRGDKHWIVLRPRCRRRCRSPRARPRLT